jgi:phosphoribosylformylglycinamidine synthase
MAGSMLAQVLSQTGNASKDGVPDVDDPAQLKSLIAAMMKRIRAVK